MTDHYTLPRDATESARLDVQHEAYVAVVGFVLHPRIKAALPPDARVADVGTGTGIWLQDLARSDAAAKNWSLHGFDISDAQFPQSNGAAAEDDRIAYSTLNITEPVPSHLRGTFDAVHMRLLVCGLQSHQWAQAARGAHALLKPGGWLQWHECAFKDSTLYQAVPCASRHANLTLLTASRAALARQGKVLDDVPRLGETVAEGGFEGVEDDVFSADRVPENRGRLAVAQIGALTGISRALAKADPEYALGVEEVEELLERAWEEIKDGSAYYAWAMHVVTGRRKGA